MTRRRSWSVLAVGAGLALVSCERCGGKSGDPYGCEQDGDCTVGADMACVRGRCKPAALAARDAKCGASPECRDKGLCAADHVRKGLFDSGYEIRCVALSDERCAASAGCREAGACAKNRRACLASKTSHCQSSSRCKEQGECTLDGARCVASSKSECEQSTACKRDGFCELESGRCALSPQPADCASDRPGGEPPKWFSTDRSPVPQVAARALDPPLGKSQAVSGDAATLVCQLTFDSEAYEVPEDRKVELTLRVRWADHCAVQLRPFVEDTSAHLSVPEVSLAKGDEVSVQAFHGDPLLSNHLGHGIMTFQGATPLAAKHMHLSAVCHLVAQKEAERRAAVDLKEARIKLLRARSAPSPGLKDIVELPLKIGAPRKLGYGDHLALAAGWLGWDHPEVRAELGRQEQFRKRFKH